MNVSNKELGALIDASFWGKARLLDRMEAVRETNPAEYAELKAKVDTLSTARAALIDESCNRSREIHSRIARLHELIAMLTPGCDRANRAEREIEQLKSELEFLN